MKKLLVLLLTVFALNGCEEDTTIIDATADKKMEKVYVCHYDGATDTWETLYISGNAMKAHLAHGDKEGSCDDLYTYVPDDKFEEYLIYLGYDEAPLDDYVLTANIDKIERIKFGEPCCSSPWADDGGWDEIGITDFTGLEDFIGLKSLNINKHYFKKPLDLSKMSNLEGLDITRGGYIEGPDFLDLSKNTSLKFIWLDYRSLNYLNLKNEANKNIINFFLFSGEKNVCVEVDDADYCNDNPQIWDTEGDITFSKDCSSQTFRTFVPDDGFEQHLIYLGYDDVFDDYVLTANIENITRLYIPTYANDLPDGCCGETTIYSVTGLEDFKSLKELTFMETVLKVIDLSGNVLLEKLYMFDNWHLTKIDISKNINLTELTIGLDNSLESLDLSKNVSLKSLRLDHLKFAIIDLSQNTLLTSLEISASRFTELNLTKNIALTSFQTRYNSDLFSVNVQNGNNEAISLFEINDNPNLTCIQVDNVEWSTENWTNRDPQHYFSTDCP